ncbi:hypothetical protein C2G38_2208755 [Gigaspora rosea]|uniref:Uncharacterized protein n=1 Tax=Gigaspora rosea TaxID=44941 RepID=A0A397UH36_9GLOM|nr:hypothetical protein C2G38_2208755 [Gigaspora rosea]CAG8636338.1 23271_t:CDS:1 [Gigaspora rosea]
MNTQAKANKTLTLEYLEWEAKLTELPSPLTDNIHSRLYKRYKKKTGLDPWINSETSETSRSSQIEDNKKKTEVRILPINKNASLNSRLPISILPDDPEEKRNLVIKIADFKPITFEAKPDSELIIKSVLEHLTYLKFRNSFRGIDNYNFASPQPWSSPCPICDGKHGNYGLHGEWYRNETEYCLTCNTSSNKLKFAIVT